ncbi:MAG TPA: class I SAM-dependent methyltransferase [Polyangiales bacterium]|nr:class I SAM-dependent methyltransferase [Polyangiales bacterium]
MVQELAESSYVMGHTSDEIDRLVEQSSQFRTQSELLLRAAGLAPGMRVLDIGCGPGDLSILAARLVGTGEVVGVDNALDAIEIARSRALRDGLSNVSFELCDVTQLDPAPAWLTAGAFDAVIGRYVLMHLPDASGCLRALVRYAKQDAIFTFQELDTRSAESDPPGALFGRSVQRLQNALRVAQVEQRSGSSLARTFRAAGLPEPEVLLTASIESATPDAYVFRHTAETTRTLLPLITRAGIATADEVDISTLEARLRDEALQTTSTLTNVALVGAWTRLTPRSTIRAR